MAAGGAAAADASFVGAFGGRFSSAFADLPRGDGRLFKRLRRNGCSAWPAFLIGTNEVSRLAVWLSAWW